MQLYKGVGPVDSGSLNETGLREALAPLDLCMSSSVAGRGWLRKQKNENIDRRR